MNTKVIQNKGDCDEVLMGGDPERPTWEEYLEGFLPELQERLVSVRKCIEENGYIGTLASNFCNRKCFEFEDGFTLGFTWRAWGDLMQAIIGKREGYLKYYC